MAPRSRIRTFRDDDILGGCRVYDEAKAMMTFKTRDEICCWLTEQAKERVVHDAMELVRRDGLTKDCIKAMLPAMMAEAMAWRDEMLANVDSMVMDVNANTPEHTTVN
jgi:hypothetical protein